MWKTQLPKIVGEVVEKRSEDLKRVERLSRSNVVNLCFFRTVILSSEKVVGAPDLKIKKFRIRMPFRYDLSNVYKYSGSNQTIYGELTHNDRAYF